MTAPVVSLLATPPDMGGQGAGPAAGAAANNDDVFAALVSALFEAAQGAPSSDPSTPQPQSPRLLLADQQVPQSTDTNTPAKTGTPSLTIGDASFLNLLQPAAPVGTTGSSSVFPAPSGQDAQTHEGALQTMPPPSLPPLSMPATNYRTETTQAPLAAAASPENIALAGEAPASAPSLPQVMPAAVAASAGNLLQQETPDASSASETQILPDVQTQISQPAESGSNGSTNRVSEPRGGDSAQSASPFISRANSRIAARQGQKADVDEQGQQPLTPVLTLPEMAPAVIAQLLAAEPTPASSNAAAPIAAPAEPQSEAFNFAQTPQPGDTGQEIAGPSGEPQQAGTVATDAIAAPAQTLDALPLSDGATLPADNVTPSAQASPAPPQIAPNRTEDVKASDSETTLPAAFHAPNRPDVTITTDAEAQADQQAPIAAPAPANAAPPSDTPEQQSPISPTRVAASAANTMPPTGQDDDGVSSEPAGPPPATPAQGDVTAKDDSKSALRPIVSSTDSTAPATADAGPAVSTGDPTDTRDPTSASDVSNSAAQAAAINIVNRPDAAIAHDVVTSAAAPAPAVSPDVSGRLAAISRATRAPTRGVSGANRDAVEAQGLSPNPSAPDSTSAPEKSQPARPVGITQNTETAKTVSQAPPTHVAAAAAEPETPKAHDPADLAPAADTLQPQAARTETPPAPAAPQPQPPALDIVPSATAMVRGFEQPMLYAGAPRQDDVPVRFAFNAPNVPDNSGFDALALKIASHSSDGDSHFSIRLDPPELGKIEVNLSVDVHGHAEAELSADKPQTLELLQKDASTLERALKDAGLNLSGGLAFSLKGEGRSQAWRDSQSGRGRAAQIAAVDAASASAAMTARAALAAQAYGLPMSNLDIRV